MAEGIRPVEWAGSQAVVTLPEEIDTSNAGQIREQLLAVINRGPAVLVADLSATVACDYSGTDALLRAYGRAVLSGTAFRLVVSSDIVRRMLTVGGLDRLVPVYPSLEAATAAGAGGAGGAEGRPVHEPPILAVIAPPAARPAGAPAAAAVNHAGRPEELLESVLSSVFQIGMILQAATGPSPDLTTERIDEVLRRLDDVVRSVRDHLFAEPGHPAEQGLPPISPRGMDERLARTAKRTVLLRERVAQTARAMQFAAADTAAFLERRAELVEPPPHLDYATEIKRWRAFAERARQMAHRWEQGTGTAP